MKLLAKCAGAALFLLIFAACSFDYEEGRIAEDLEETVPETILENFVQVRTLEGKPDYRVYGDRAETYGKKKETIIKDVLFQDFNPDGEIEIEGTADKITYYSESDNAEMSGNLQFYNAEEEIEIRAEYLFWHDESETLSTREEEPVTLIKENGTNIQGLGFTAFGKTKTITFALGVSGVWVEDEDEDEEEGKDEGGENGSLE